MQLNALLLLLLGAAVTPPALALPLGGSPGPVSASVSAVAKRQSDLVAVTDSYSFSLTLAQFIAKRDAKDPASLDWSSDGCSSSPDNPLGFPFQPGCYRHDFGYRNFKAQSRFTESNRLRLDQRLLEDLDFQCESVSSILRPLCSALADVYYAAVRAFGGDGVQPGKRDETYEELVKTYEEKLAIYNAMVEAAKRDGIIEA